MRTKVLILLTLIIALVLMGCPAPSESQNGSSSDGGTGVALQNGEEGQDGEVPQYGGVYRFPLDTDPPTLDPAMVTDTVSDKVIARFSMGARENKPGGTSMCRRSRNRGMSTRNARSGHSISRMTFISITVPR